jgi:hypothetical protein
MRDTFHVTLRLNNMRMYTLGSFLAISSIAGEA